MALDKNVLSDNIYNQLIELFDDMQQKAEDDIDGNEYTKEKYAQEFARRIAEEVVSHIVDNGEITLNIRNPAQDAMNAAVVVPQDGGANLKLTFSQYMQGISTNVGTGTIS